MVYYILVGIFSSNLLYHKKDCFPTLLRVVAVFFIARFFTAPFAIYAILSFYIAYMKQFMLSALEDTLVKLIHKRIFF